MSRFWRGALRGLNGLAQVAAVLVTMWFCAGALFFALLAFDLGYSDPATPAQWMRAVARSANDAVLLVVMVAAALCAACTVAVVAAVRRRPAWTAIGIACGAMLAVTLGILSTSPSRMDGLTARAIEAVAGAPGAAPPLPAPAPTPVPTTRPLTAGEARDEMERMLELTLSAAVGAPRGADDHAITAADIEIAAGACGETGAAWHTELAFTTDDNAASLRSILSVWDAEGYAPDRAIQEDIRYSQTLPVERMTVRDRTTIDGLIHLRVVSRCATVGE